MKNFNLDFPISLIKKEQRIIEGIATADNIDKVGDVIDFEASLEAFKNWAGNIREMHEPKAVGKAINYEPVRIKGEDGEEYNAIKVQVYISKGAQDTWEKVLDGTLKAFSVGGSIVEKQSDIKRLFRGKPVSIIKKYRLGELSLVDNPANGLATVDIIKRNNDGDLEYALEDLINKAKKQPLKDPKGGLTAAGRRHFKQTEGANLKPGVRGAADTPEKMRRKGSFLTRFFTNPSGPMKDEKGRPTRLALSAAAWGEPVPQNMQDAAKLAAKGRRLLERYANTKKKSADEILEEDVDLLTKEMDYFLNADLSDILNDIELNHQDVEDILKSLTEWFREEWVDISRPKAGGGFEPCGREDAGKGKYPKCVPASRAARMTQAEIDSAVRRKRRAESSTRREGKKPIYVSTEANKAEPVNVPTNPELYSRVKSEAKQKFRVYPSAYANAWIVREYKKRGGGYRIAKEGEVTTGNMGSGIRNPTQGYPSGRRKKKENEMNKEMHESSSLVDALNNTLCNAMVLYFSAHRAHWNVEGPDFFEYHSMFGEIYEDIYGSIDSLAENVRKLGGFPHSMSQMEDMASLEDDSSTSDARKLASNLYLKNLEFVDILKAVFMVANNANEQGIANFISERIDMHDKWTWHLKSSLMSSGVDIPMPEEEEEEDDEEGEMEDSMEENDATYSMDIMNLLNAVLNSSIGKFEKSAVIELQENLESIDELLQNDVQYDTVVSMNEQDLNRLSLIKRLINWLVPDVQENASTLSIVEDSNATQEEEMDIEILKDALSAVVDEKLATFASSIKEEVEAAVQEKIDNLSKGFDAQATELQGKLEAAEKALADQEEQVKAFGKSGAIKKSVDPEDDDEGETITKSQPASVWNNVYLPQGIISSLGYRS